MRVFGRGYTLSHLIWLYVTGSWPTNEIDHKDGDTLNDRWDNLRPATRVQQEANRGARSNSKTGVKGVIFKRGRYEARIYRRRYHRFLGGFKTLKQAAAAYEAEAKKYDGEFIKIDRVKRRCVAGPSALAHVRPRSGTNVCP
jgi:hypothetical protein